MTFILRLFHFLIISAFLNSRASIRVVGHFCGIKIGTLRISCKRQIDVIYRIAVHVVANLYWNCIGPFVPTKKQSLSL